jgi:hypothetical protein
MIEMEKKLNYSGVAEKFKKYLSGEISDDEMRGYVDSLSISESEAVDLIRSIENTPIEQLEKLAGKKQSSVLKQAEKKSRGNVQINTDGSWTIFMQGNKGADPYRAVEELLSASSAQFEELARAGVTGSSRI